VHAHDALADDADGPDVALGQLVGLERLDDGVVDLLLGEGDFHEHDLGGHEMPVHVVLEPEYAGLAARMPSNTPQP